MSEQEDGNLDGVKESPAGTLTRRRRSGRKSVKGTSQDGNYRSARRPPYGLLKRPSIYLAKGPTVRLETQTCMVNPHKDSTVQDQTVTKTRQIVCGTEAAAVLAIRGAERVGGESAGMNESMTVQMGWFFHQPSR